MRDVTLTPTGRELEEPAAMLQECVDEGGLKHTVVHFNEAYRGHDALTVGVELISSFMEYPMVTGLVECSLIDTEALRFGYPTGTIWTIKEVLRGFDQVGQPVGARAALEMCYLAGMVLFEAGETGPLQGCFSHGNINPWRIGLKADGQLQVFGYGLPQVEMLSFLSGGNSHIDDLSMLYAPPERLEAQAEQPSSDTYSLAIMAAELITGRSLFDGLTGQPLWDAIKLAEGVQRALGHKGIPKAIRDFLARALIYDPDARLQGEAFVAEVGGLLDGAKLEGRTLREVMLRMRQQRATSSRKLVSATATSAFTPADLAAMAAAADEEDDVELEEAGESRWGRTTGRHASRSGDEPRRRRRRPPEDEPRQRRRDAPTEDVQAKTPSDAESEPRRRRRGKAKTEEEPELELDPPTDPSGPAEGSTPADDVLFDEPDTAEEEEVPSPAAEPEPEVPPRRRRRKSSKKAGEAKAADESTPEPPEPEPTPEPEPDPEATAGPEEDRPSEPRRRRRGASPESVEEPTAGRRRRAAAKPEEVLTPRARRKKPEADQGTENAAEDPKADPPPRRRRRKKKS